MHFQHQGDGFRTWFRRFLSEAGGTAPLAQGCTKADTSASKFLSPKFHFGSWETGKTGVTDNLSGVCVRTRKGQKYGASPKSFGGI